MRSLAIVIAFLVGVLGGGAWVVANRPEQAFLLFGLLVFLWAPSIYLLRPNIFWNYVRWSWGQSPKGRDNRDDTNSG